MASVVGRVPRIYQLVIIGLLFLCEGFVSFECLSLVFAVVDPVVIIGSSVPISLKNLDGFSQNNLFCLNCMHLSLYLRTFAAVAWILGLIFSMFSLRLLLSAFIFYLSLIALYLPYLKLFLLASV